MTPMGTTLPNKSSQHINPKEAQNLTDVTVWRITGFKGVGSNLV